MVAVVVVLGGALVITELFPSLSGCVLSLTCTETSRMWANGSAPVGSAGGHPGTSKSREIVGFP